MDEKQTVKRIIAVTTITILGRRWFERVNGNTYFSARIIVNGQQVGYIPFQYGYGNQYEWESAQWLEKFGYIWREHNKNGSGESLWRYCERLKIPLVLDVVDVQRKKDL